MHTGEIVSQLDFFYDAAGALYGFSTQDGSKYYYVRNGQNDIVGIVDSTGEQVVSYVYDSWGKLVETTGSMAGSVGADNPFRYRGYYYDDETGFYYLQSRYYDPETGRFLNADIYAATNQGALEHNMYAYCLNNPTNMVDPTGTIAGIDDIAIAFLLALGLVGVGLISIVAMISNQMNMSNSMSSSTGDLASQPSILKEAILITMLLTFVLHIPTLPVNPAPVAPTINKTKVNKISNRINWGIGSNSQNHILNGTKGQHINGWKKFGIDPNGKGGWEKLLPILKATVDNYDKIKTAVEKDGGSLYYYIRYYGQQGLNIVVKIWQSADGSIRKLSDAWTTGKGSV